MPEHWPHLLNLIVFIPFFLVLITAPRCSGSTGNTTLFSACSSSFSCGNITNLTFPFWGGNRPSGCGYPALELTCENGSSTFISIEGMKYLVREVNQDARILRIARQDLSEGLCLKTYKNTTLDLSLFDWVVGYANFSIMYGCPSMYYVAPQFSCSSLQNQDGYFILGDVWPSPACLASVVVPIPDNMISAANSGSVDWESVLHEGFEVKLTVDGAACKECVQSKGICGYDPIANGTICYCSDQSSGSKTCASPAAPPAQPPLATPPTAAKRTKISLGTGFAIAGAGIVGILTGLWIFYLLQRRKRSKRSFPRTMTDLPPTPSSKSLLVSGSPATVSRSTPSDPSSKSELDNRSTYFGARVFSSIELEEATYNFDPSRELGTGGFGTVYYGTLRDGRAVAVKRLYEHNMKRVEQFMNEVEILMRLQHPNLVKLHGCTSRRSQELLLVYEYIPNGTVADHLFGRNRASLTPLPWSTRLDIAIQTADALAYLHASDVIHRDVKTNNILLDKSLSVKVADFGLSRLFPTDVTHVSTAPQGTPGYVDPEYHRCYQLTEKSDVYSFAVVLCELISTKPAVDITRHRHEINLASMAINRIQNSALHEFVDPNLRFDTDYIVRRTVTQVAELAFRCLQDDRDARPTMGEVLESLRSIGTERANLHKAEVVEEALCTLRGFGEDKPSERARKPEVIDVRSDDIGLLRNIPPPLSPDSTEWTGSSPTPNSV